MRVPQPLEDMVMELDFPPKTESFGDRPPQLETPGTLRTRKVRYFWPICYVVFATVLGPVLFFSLGLLSLDLRSTQGPSWMLWVLTTILVVSALVILIVNIIRSFRIRGEDDSLHSVRAMLVVTYGMIPFFVLHACLTPYSIILIGFAGLEEFYRFAVVYLFAAPLLFMLPGSFYGIRVVRLSLLEKKLHPFTAILHGIIQFIPVLGVLDAAFLSVVKWKTGKIATVVVLIAAILFLALVLAWIAGEFNLWDFGNLSPDTWEPFKDSIEIIEILCDEFVELLCSKQASLSVMITTSLSA